MGLTNTIALCRQADVKSALGLTVATHDETINRLILAVSSRIEDYCGRKFRKEAVTLERFRGYGHPVYFVARAPIDTGASITIAFDGTAIASDDFAVEDAATGRIFREGGFTTTALSVRGANYEPYAGAEQGLWTIAYTGGFVLPNDSTGTRSLPYDLEEIAIQAAVSLFRSRSRDRSVRSESLLSWSASYSDSAAEGFDGILTASQRAALAPWTKVPQA